jgi:putative chitinase
MTLTLTQLKAVMPKIGVLAVAYLPWLNSAMAEFKIDTPARAARFLAQLAHETGDLNTVTENLNYSADGLANTWPSRYAKTGPDGHYLLTVASVDFNNIPMPAGRKVPNGLALRLHRQPQAIANNVYANRMGNGDEASGDGWRFRGAGGIQLTGHDNQLACAAYFRIPADKIGDWLRTPEGVCRSAAWCWYKAGCNALADAGRDDAIADTINIGHITPAIGDAIGYADRLARTHTNLETLA